MAPGVVHTACRRFLVPSQDWTPWRPLHPSPFSGSWIQHVSTIGGIFDISQWEWHHDRICASDRRINHTFSG